VFYNKPEKRMSLDYNHGLLESALSVTVYVAAAIAADSIANRTNS
jgi:hypothetical protein